MADWPYGLADQARALHLAVERPECPYRIFEALRAARGATEARRLMVEPHPPPGGASVIDLLAADRIDAARAAGRAAERDTTSPADRT